MRTNLGLKIKDQATGKTEKEFRMKSKLSKYGKEAKDELTIDKVGNRKIHHVEEQDKNGQWITVHHEDEPLKKERTHDK